MKLEKFTLYVMIGPSGCGKSTLSKSLTQKIPSCKIVSSDELRQQILGEALDKYDEKMMLVSSQAFRLLSSTLEVYMSYPVHTHHIIVDTTGLDKRFRQDMVILARENNYKVKALIIDTPIMRNHSNPRIYYKHLRKLNHEVFPYIKREGFDEVIRIKNVEKFLEEITIDSEGEYGGDWKEHPFIVGDVHGCLDALHDCLRQVGYSIENGKIFHKLGLKTVLVGDILDKGKQVPETVKFILDNADSFVVVMGNHEHMYRLWHGGGQRPISMEMVKEHFDSLLIEDEEFKTNALNLVNKCVPFFRTQKYIVTHAPCLNRNLGKTDRFSLKNQRVMYYPKRGDYSSDEEWQAALTNDLLFLKEEANGSHPYHIFGHIPLRETLIYRNKMGIDTGCAYGNYLTLVDFSEGRYQLRRSQNRVLASC